MSTKFDTLMENARKDFDIAKESFLDALADFLTDNKHSVLDGDHFSFSIRINESGTDELGKPRYKISFASHSGPSLEDSHKNTQLLFYTTLPSTALENFLKSEYHANISHAPTNSKVYTYLRISLPFAWQQKPRFFARLLYL